MVLRARSCWEVGDLSPLRKERQGACSGSLTIGSSTPKELHSTLFWPSPLLSKFFIIQVSYYPSSSLTKPRPSSLHHSRFFFPVFSLGWKVFSLMISTLMIFRFSPRPSHRLGAFSLIDPLSGFPPEFPTGLGRFSPATWPFETHQLPHGARIFSVVSWFSSLASFISLGGFSLSLYFDDFMLNGARVQRGRQL